MAKKPTPIPKATYAGALWVVFDIIQQIRCHEQCLIVFGAKHIRLSVNDDVIRDIRHNSVHPQCSITCYAFEFCHQYQHPQSLQAVADNYGYIIKYHPECLKASNTGLFKTYDAMPIRGQSVTYYDRDNKVDIECGDNNVILNDLRDCSLCNRSLRHIRTNYNDVRESITFIPHPNGYMTFTETL